MHNTPTITTMQALNIIKAYNNIFLQERKRIRKCLVENCYENCINSHILQKNGILRQISVDNHLIQLSRGIINKKSHDSLEFKKVGINEAYSFPGFCKYHDSEIFKEIENKATLNFEDVRCKQLFSYRTLCNELRIKEIVLDVSNNFKKLLPIEEQITYDWFIEGLKQGIQNLKYFKNDIESNLLNGTNSFDYYTLVLPKLEICITGPFNIENPERNKTSDLTDIGKVPFITSILNIFPYKENLIVIIAIHKKYTCEWTINLWNNLQKPNYLKSLSDLVVLRTEIWCASPNLINKIPKSVLHKYRIVWKENILNFSYSIPVDFNLFNGC